MAQEMLLATQQAAWAGQSAAEAAWWGLLVNSLAMAGALGALWYAVIQGSRAARYERLQAAMQTTRILELIGPVVEFSAYDDRGMLSIELAESMLEQGILSRAISGVAQSPIDRIPHVGATSYLEVLRITLPTYEARLRSLSAINMRYDDEARTIAEAYDFFRLIKQVVLTNSSSARRELRARFP